jgi:UDP-N-acetylmuramate dehydrogenase
MRVGGPADLLIICSTAEQVRDAVQLARAHEVPWRILGGGCNVLISDAGVRGLVILNRAERTRIDEDGTVWAETGAPLAILARETVFAGLAGLTWATGLPGTVGGAVVGNAGAFGGDIASVLYSARVLAPDGTVADRPAEWFDFVYRGSRVKFTPPEERGVVLSATFHLRPGDRATLAERSDEIMEWRRTRHPSGATMGSTFKNAPDAHAGRMIEGVGLKGYRIGGVEVSEQHANFLINTGQATATQVLELIRHIQAEVEQKLGVELEPEIELVGEWRVGRG